MTRSSQIIEHTAGRNAELGLAGYSEAS